MRFRSVCLCPWLTGALAVSLGLVTCAPPEKGWGKWLPPWLHPSRGLRDAPTKLEPWEYEDDDDR